MKNYMMLAIISIMIGGCNTFEVLPGLCYTDNLGTYLCPEEENIYIDPIPTEYDRPHNCSMYYGLDEEQWLWCMDPDNDQFYDPYYKQREEFRKDLFREKLRESRHGREAIV